MAAQRSGVGARAVAAAVGAEEILGADELPGLFDHLHDAAVKVASVEGLDQKFGDARVARGDDAAFFAEARHQDDRHVRVGAALVVADSAGEGDAVTGLHHPVRDHHVGVGFAEDGKAVLAVHGRVERADAEGLKDGFGEFEHRLVILHHQNLKRFKFIGHGSAPTFC